MIFTKTKSKNKKGIYNANYILLVRLEKIKTKYVEAFKF